MELTPMQYKTYVWPHNPRTYTIRYTRQVAVQKVPFGRYAMQDLGLTKRIMEGEGEFFGPDAYEQFKKLAVVFYQDGPGRLIHPVWQSAEAYFVGLALAQEPKKDYVRYTFTFWETCSRHSTGLVPAGTWTRPPSGGGTISPQAPTRPQPSAAAQYHVVQAGETMWSIAQRWGLAWAGLLELNPQVKNPNIIMPGQQLRVR